MPVLQEHLDRECEACIRRALDRTARALGISRATLCRELRRVPSRAAPP